MLVYFALDDAKVPNANGFASQWNIGFRFFIYGLVFILCIVENIVKKMA